jgi:GxxExxY protein
LVGRTLVETQRTGAKNMEVLDITGKIIESAILVHNELGLGLLESVYETCLAEVLSDNGLIVKRQQSVPVVFKGKQIDMSLRIDLLVNDTAVVVELKAVETILPIHEAQLFFLFKAFKEKCWSFN